MTPEEIKTWLWSRCHDDGDCVLWDGACDGSLSPTVRMPRSRKVESARRVLLKAMGIDVEGKLATTTCDHPRCMAEEHVVAWTRKQLQKRSGLKVAGNMVRAAKIAAQSRKKAILNMEKVRAMRESGMTTREAAAAYGVTQSTAAQAIRGHTWKDYGANPFHGLGARP